jgi:hypothetical protein
MSRHEPSPQEIPVEYQKLFSNLINAQSFEDLCSILHDEISNTSPDFHKDLYSFLSQNKKILNTIAQHQDHEKFYSTLWTLVYAEPSDLTDLHQPQTQIRSLRFTKAPPMDRHHAPAVIENSHYPVVIENSHYPVVVDSKHYPMVRSAKNK